MFICKVREMSQPKTSVCSQATPLSFYCVYVHNYITSCVRQRRMPLQCDFRTSMSDPTHLNAVLFRLASLAGVQ